MAIFEYSGTLKYKDKAGNLHMMKPRTTSGNVEGLTQLLAEKENSGAAATALENAKAYTDQKIEGIPTPDVSAQITAHNESQDAHPYIRRLIPTKTSQIENDSGYLTQHQDISGKLDKPTNDATATAGQLLTKTADGQEWQDREKDILVVNMITNDGNTIASSDKTFDEVQEALIAGKTTIVRLRVSITANQFASTYELAYVGGPDTNSNTITFSALVSSNTLTISMSPQDIKLKTGSVQSLINVEGLLKGGGGGNINIAAPDEDYVDPYGDGSNLYVGFTRAPARANIATGEKLSVLFGKIAKWFADLGSLAFKSTVAKSDLASDVQTSLGKADSALQRAPVTSVNSRTGAVKILKGDVGLSNVDNVKQYSVSNPPPYPVTSVNGKTGAVTVPSVNVPSTASLLKGDGSGGLVAATSGSDYIASGNIVKQTLVATETTPTEDYAINWVYG